MATIKLKCDTCKREISLLENKEGMTHYSKCVITDGCRGSLYRLKREPDNIREFLPSPVRELEDYQPRRAFHRHNQGIASKFWKIDHRLGNTSLAVVVYDENNVELDNDDFSITYVSDNEIRVTFSTPKAGQAHLISRSSGSDTYQGIAPGIQTAQVTSDAYFNFAIPTRVANYYNPNAEFEVLPDCVAGRVPTGCVRLEVEITQPSQEPVTCIETLEENIDSASPWLGWNNILLRGRRNYTIRGKSLLDFLAFGGGATPATIQQGTRIRFLRIDYGDGILRELNGNDAFNELRPRSLLILLANAPYERADKNLNEVLDVGTLFGDEIDYLEYLGDEVFVSQDKIEKTYPKIRRVVK